MSAKLIRLAACGYILVLMNTPLDTNDEQIARLYAAAPVLFWPWIWIQLIRIDSYMRSLDLGGTQGNLIIEVGPWFTLYIVYMSDNLSGFSGEQSFKLRDGKITFASLCHPLAAGWAYRDAPISPMVVPLHTLPSWLSIRAPQALEAMRPVP